MASAKLMIPKRSAPYYVLTANVTVHGKRVRRYGRFDFDPTVLKTHRQRENAAIEAALVFERAEQQKDYNDYLLAARRLISMER